MHDWQRGLRSWRSTSQRLNPDYSSAGTQNQNRERKQISLLRNRSETGGQDQWSVTSGQWPVVDRWSVYGWTLGSDRKLFPLATDHWSLLTDHWSLVTGHWPLATDSATAHCSLPTAHYRINVCCSDLICHRPSRLTKVSITRARAVTPLRDV